MRRILLMGAFLATTMTAGRVQAEQDPVKLAVLNDQSSSFAMLGGTEVVDAVRLAIKDFGGQVLGKPIGFVTADHQNKPDIGMGIAREWISVDGVDAVFDVANSAVALGVNTLLGEKKKLGFFVSPVTDRITEEDCNGYVMAWAYDAYSVARTSAKAQISQGHATWFVLSPDYEAGKVLEKTVVDVVAASGGKVVGTVRAPLGTADFSSYLLQAQSSGAKMLMLTLNGPELLNALKQIQEFGLVERGMAVGVSTVHQADARGIGLDTLQRIEFAAPWYWTENEGSREFAAKMKAITGHMPGWVAAASYSAATTYLNAIKTAGTKDPDAVLKVLHTMKIDDFFAHNATLWPNGRLVHDMYFLAVRKPGEVADPEDVFKIQATVNAADAFRPLADSKCKLAHP